MIDNKETSEGISFTQNKNITASPSYQNPEMTYLDELEDSCWRLFCDYCTLVGIKFDDPDDIDFSIAKAIQEKIIEEIEKISNIPFPVSKDR